MSAAFQAVGRSRRAPFTLRVHRGDGMALLAMNWRRGSPPDDFVGFAIEYREPDGDRFFPLKNRLGFQPVGRAVNPNRLSTRLSPIQKFRWVHFPRRAELAGPFVYRVTPVFMNRADELSYGDPQEAALELRRETVPGVLNVTFTRGFVSSQAFVERFGEAGPISKLLPARADRGLTFAATHPKAAEALAWMGFEARDAILEVLGDAIADETAQVRVVAYDLNEPELVSRLERLGDRLRVIVDDDGAHGEQRSAETQAAARLAASAGAGNVKRQHMGKLQHNKTIVVDGARVRAVVCGSTNFSWRGFFVQANNAVVLRGEQAVAAFLSAFDAYWDNDDADDFAATAPARLTALGLPGVDAEVGFSPYGRENAQLEAIARDIRRTRSSLFYSLAFLFQTPGRVQDSIRDVMRDDRRFVYGMSDRPVGGLDLQKPDGNVAPVGPAALGRDAPEPFKSEPTAGAGNRMHHKFVAIDFDRPNARVYLGSYNFSVAADKTNGENLLVVRDRRVAVTYTVEALRLFDHYHFRVAQQEARRKREQLVLARPPRRAREKPWWDEYYADPRKARDRELFA